MLLSIPQLLLLPLLLPMLTFPLHKCMLQVNHFPYLHLSRTPDWGWLMENMW